MGAFFGLVILALVIASMLLGSGIGIAYLLRWIMPSVDLGMGMLIGVLTIAISAYFVGKITNSIRENDVIYIGGDEEDDEDDGPKASVYPFRRNRSSKSKRRR